MVVPPNFYAETNYWVVEMPGLEVSNFIGLISTIELSKPFEFISCSIYGDINLHLLVDVYYILIKLYNSGY